MRVVLDGGDIIELGETDATPTISLVDYSRRETDDFGITTVVERGFARRMSVKLILPFDQADALQRALADLRATPAQWVADDRFAWLDFRGFYKDFEIDLNMPPISYCTLTIEGLVDTEAFTDTGDDPAPNGGQSTLQLLQPAPVEGAALISSNIAEDDYPEWDAGTSYAVGERVILAATHRIYESGSASNLGNDPAGISGKWNDVGPTNRWAMFDQALGSKTTGDSSIVVEVQNGAINAMALLDVTASTVRVQIAATYDQTRGPNASGTVTFLDIPSTTDSAAVTISGGGPVSAGTLLLGRLVTLGQTVDAPKAGITDFSRKEADEFGEVTVVERAWAKRVTLDAMITTEAIDLVAGRIAAVRALPSLWIGKEGIETLTAYGFFKDFQIEVDATVSKLSLSIEGLSTAGKLEPLGAMINWPDIADPDGTKPEDNATVGAPGTTPVGSLTGDEVVSRIVAIDDILAPTGEVAAAIQGIRDDLGTVEDRTDTVEAQIAGTSDSYLKEQITAAAGDAAAAASDITTLRSDVFDPGGLAAQVTEQAGTLETLEGRTLAYWQVEADAGPAGTDAFITAQAQSEPGGAVTSDVGIGADTFLVYNRAAGEWIKTLEVSGGDVRIYGNLAVDGSVSTGNLQLNSATEPTSVSFAGASDSFSVTGGWPAWITVASTSVAITEDGATVIVFASGNLQVSETATGGGLTGIQGYARLLRGSTVIRDQQPFGMERDSTGDSAYAEGPYSALVHDIPGIGTYTYSLQIIGAPLGGSGTRVASWLAIDGGLATLQLKR